MVSTVAGQAPTAAYLEPTVAGQAPTMAYLELTVADQLLDDQPQAD